MNQAVILEKRLVQNSCPSLELTTLFMDVSQQLQICNIFFCQEFVYALRFHIMKTRAPF